MAKRRTRKQKSKAKHPFLVSPQISLDEVANTIKTASKKDTVKGQTKKLASKKIGSGTKPKKAENKAEYENLSLIKKHLMKSLSLAALILSLEVVIYLIRQG